MRDKRYLTALTLLVLAGVASMYLESRAKLSGPVLPRHVPDRIGDWTSTPFSTVMPSDLRPGDYILREYRKGGEATIKVMIVFSPTENYHPPALCYRGIGLNLFYQPPVSSSSGKMRLAGLGANQVHESVFIYHGFYVGGRIVPDGVEKKWYEVKERILKGRVEQYFLELMLAVEKGAERMAPEKIVSFLDLLEPYLLDVP